VKNMASEGGGRRKKGEKPKGSEKPAGESGGETRESNGSASAAGIWRSAGEISKKIWKINLAA
jgi:hypothetical protein